MEKELVEKTLFAELGFHWDRSAILATTPTHSIERVCFRFHRMLPEFVWDAGVLEGNPFTYPEVKTLLDGITVGGRKISDQEQILNLAESSRRLLALVKISRFALDKATFCDLHAIVAKNEALEWGHFRGEGQEPATRRMAAWANKGVTRRCPPRRGETICTRSLLPA